MDEATPVAMLLQAALVTGLIGGGAAWMTGRAIAQTWRPFWHVVIYAALLGAAVRFVHFALFGGDLLLPEAYAVETLYLALVGLVSWRLMRASQMATQYDWLFERSGPFTWRARSTDGTATGGSGTMSP